MGQKHRLTEYLLDEIKSGKEHASSLFQQVMLGNAEQDRLKATIKSLNSKIDVLTIDATNGFDNYRKEERKVERLADAIAWVIRRIDTSGPTVPPPMDSGYVSHHLLHVLEATGTHWVYEQSVGEQQPPQCAANAEPQS